MRAGAALEDAGTDFHFPSKPRATLTLAWEGSCDPGPCEGEREPRGGCARTLIYPGTRGEATRRAPAIGAGSATQSAPDEKAARWGFEAEGSGRTEAERPTFLICLGGHGRRSEARI